MKTEWIKQLRNAETKNELGNIWAQVMAYRHIISQNTFDVLFDYYWSAVQRVEG